MTSSDNHLKTPVLLIVFNRPETTRKIFDAIRLAKPETLYISADGPRKEIQEDAENCEAVRSVVRGVDWDCDLHVNFKDENLGCRAGVVAGIDWFFSHVEEGVILEDDTLPHPSFFRFCEELLIRYRDDDRIMHISGNNFQFGRRQTPYSYYFSRYPHIWGWATWRRSWRHYDADMRLWPEVAKSDLFQQAFDDEKSYDYRKQVFQKAFQGEINSWDPQWVFTCWAQNGLAILPKANLVSNIGFGETATHTIKKNALSDMDAFPMSFPMHHPTYVIRDSVADGFTERMMFMKRPFLTEVFKYLVGRVTSSRNQH
jgi:hypothetical protein